MSRITSCTPGKYTETKCHSLLPLIALLDSGNKLFICTSLDKLNPISLKSKPSTFKWHTTKPLLIVALENGELLLVDQNGAIESTIKTTHSKNIESIEVGFDDSFITTADKSGVVNIWTLKESAVELRSKFKLPDRIIKQLITNDCIISAISKMIYLTSFDGKVELAKTFTKQISSLHWTHDDNLLVMLQDTTTFIFRVQDSALIRMKELKFTEKNPQNEQLYTELLGDTLIIKQNNHHLLAWCISTDKDTEFGLTDDKYISKIQCDQWTNQLYVSTKSNEVIVFDKPVNENSTWKMVELIDLKSHVVGFQIGNLGQQIVISTNAGTTLAIQSNANDSTVKYQDYLPTDANTKSIDLFNNVLSLCQKGSFEKAIKIAQSSKINSFYKLILRQCIKVNRTDLYGHCFNQLGIIGARQAMQKIDETELHLISSTASLFLGDLEEAEQILASAADYTALNELYQNSGQWTKALELSESHDRLNKENTFYSFGSRLNDMMDIGGAVAFYEKSGSLNELVVPQIMQNEPAMMYAYADASTSDAVIHWSAEFAESNGDTDKAQELYKKAKSTLLFVRKALLIDDTEEAISLTESADQDKNQCHYQLGLYFESKKNISDSLYHFEASECYDKAIRIAILNKLPQNLTRLALQGSKKSMITVAQYFEIYASPDRAIPLYFRGGQLEKALQLSLSSGNLMALGDIALELGKQLSPQLLQQCLHYYVETKEYEKMVTLLIKVSKCKEAIRVCEQENIIITEDMITEMGVIDDYTGKILADTVFKQKSYVQASKLYVALGDRLSALKSLMCTGDYEKVIFFANVSGGKQKEIYVIAANYLQSLDWKQDELIHKNIILFYNKAKAFSNLANFYEMCASVEIESFANYSKADIAVQEAIKSWESESKIRNVDQQISALQTKSTYYARVSSLESEFNEKKAKELLTDPSLEFNGVKRGDVFGILFKEFANTNQMGLAFGVYNMMIESGVRPQIYLSNDAINLVLKANGIEPDKESEGINSIIH